MGQANKVKMGIMPAAIWMDDPTETPIVNSILPFIAIQTDVTCSAAYYEEAGSALQNFSGSARFLPYITNNRQEDQL